MGILGESEAFMKMIRVGIVGAGPMGLLHARTVARFSEQGKACVLTAVVDHHDGRADAVAQEFGARASSDLEAGLVDVDAVIVCVPTSAHFSVTELLLERDLDVLVEKPLAGSVAEGLRLGILARERGCILQVGHVEWYNQGWRAAAKLAGKPRSIEVERLNPPGDRGLDIDVVQDFMLHDLDWVTRFLGEEVVELEAEGRCVMNDKLDEAEAMLRFHSGCQVRLRASRVYSERRRRVRIEGSEGAATADLLTRRVKGSGSTGDPGLDPLEAQWTDFLESLRSREDPKTDAAVGVAALEIVDRVRESIVQTSGSLDRDDDSALRG
jgi:predicted dehydrogenase